jgi:excisionase family DNA binding protein
MSDETNQSCLTLTVPEAGARYLGLKPARAYQAAARGEIPVIKIGRLLRVPQAGPQPKDTAA